MQQGQVFELKKRAVDGRPVRAYRYRTEGPGFEAVVSELATSPLRSTVRTRGGRGQFSSGGSPHCSNSHGSGKPTMLEIWSSSSIPSTISP
jgi:hypothetical protein